MYTAIRQPDGSLYFALHHPPERLSPAEARAALGALNTMLDDLRRRAGHTASPAADGRTAPRIPRRRRWAPRRPAPARTRGEP